MTPRTIVILKIGAIDCAEVFRVVDSLSRKTTFCEGAAPIPGCAEGGNFMGQQEISRCTMTITDHS